MKIDEYLRRGMTAQLHITHFCHWQNYGVSFSCSSTLFPTVLLEPTRKKRNPMPPLPSQCLLQDDQLLQHHKQFLTQAKAAIKKEITEGQQACNSFVTRLLCQLEEHLQWLTRENVIDLPPRWGRITAHREPIDNSAHAIIMRIAGPGEDEITLIKVDGDDAASALVIRPLQLKCGPLLDVVILTL